ncbi:MAG: ribulose-phosphate 3-epimerase [Chloroflexi bacterium]|nr:ribulose-phosphate 3-epimerase [Chloroflexota bacterium]
MSNPNFIAPSILSADFARLGEQIAEVEANGADWIHIDVMDGHFVPNLTMGPFIVKTCKRISKLPLDVHLMIFSPERYIEDYAAAGANRLTVHVEASNQLHRTLQTIRQLGCKPGVALNPGTPASILEPILHLCDLVLVMTVNPGYSGQEFLPETLPKIRQIREMLDKENPKALVEVDGGISVHTLPQVKEAGAQVFVAASAIFNHSGGIATGLRELKDRLGKLAL